MPAILALVLPIVFLMIVLWAIDTLGRIKVEQRAIAASLVSMNAKLDRLLGDDRSTASLPPIPPYRRN